MYPCLEPRNTKQSSMGITLCTTLKSNSHAPNLHACKTMSRHCPHLTQHTQNVVEKKKINKVSQKACMYCLLTSNQVLNQWLISFAWRHKQPIYFSGRSQCRGRCFIKTAQGVIILAHQNGANYAHRYSAT